MRRLYIKDKDGNYVPAPIIRGDDGREISLRATDTHIQWKYDDTEWTNLVALSELKGKQGDKGTVGAHFTPSVSDDGVLSWTNNGELANPQPVNIRGPQGVQGAQGRGLDIQGTYSSLTLLEANVTAAEQGDIYQVGTAAPYTLYMWDTTVGAGRWVSLGTLQGPNEISTDTATALNGLLKGNDSTVQVAQSGVDYAAPAIDTVVTASASAWSNNTITLSVTGVMTDSKLEIGLSETATDEQYAAATAAQIRATGSGDGTVTLKAVAAPSVDLPILIRRLS